MKSPGENHFSVATVLLREVLTRYLQNDELLMYSEFGINSPAQGTGEN
jgi:hypothetical protein